jgi:DNA-binding NarL/FixJ family response regulator
VGKIRVFLADDHPVVRSGLRALLGAQADMVLAGEAADGAEAVLGVVQTCPDVAILDVSMPIVSGAKATEEIRRRSPTVKVLALSAFEDAGYVQQMLAAGASGYVVKRVAADDLASAIRRVAAGQTYLDPTIAGGLVAHFARRPPGGAGAAGAALSERETDVLRRIARGHPVKEIAAALDVGARTIETYKARAMEKLGLKNRADIVRHALENGWLRDD